MWFGLLFNDIIGIHDQDLARVVPQPPEDVAATTLPLPQRSRSFTALTPSKRGSGGM